MPHMLPAPEAPMPGGVREPPEVLRPVSREGEAADAERDGSWAAGPCGSTPHVAPPKPSMEAVAAD